MNAAGRWMLIEATALPCAIWLAFRLIGVPRTQALLRRWAGTAHRKLLSSPDRQTTIRSARLAQRLVKHATGIGGNCLVRSLTLWTMLSRRGIPTNLRVGFRKRDGRIDGHAWLELDGAPINESLQETLTYVAYEQPATFDLWRQIRCSHQRPPI